MDLEQRHPDRVSTIKAAKSGTLGPYRRPAGHPSPRPGIRPAAWTRSISNPSERSRKPHLYLGNAGAAASRDLTGTWGRAAVQKRSSPSWAWKTPVCEILLEEQRESHAPPVRDVVLTEQKGRGSSPTSDRNLSGDRGARSEAPSTRNHLSKVQKLRATARQPPPSGDAEGRCRGVPSRVETNPNFHQLCSQATSRDGGGYPVERGGAPQSDCPTDGFPADPQCACGAIFGIPVGSGDAQEEVRKTPI